MAVLADDLIWSTRLVAAVRSAGAEPVALRSIGALESAGSDLAAVIVDLTGRRYDGPAAVAAASAGGRPTLAVGPHDDEPLRAAARAAGAERVLAYRVIAEAGGDTIRTWLDRHSQADLADRADPAERAANGGSPSPHDPTEVPAR